MCISFSGSRGNDGPQSSLPFKVQGFDKQQDVYPKTVYLGYIEYTFEML